MLLRKSLPYLLILACGLLLGWKAYGEQPPNHAAEESAPKTPPTVSIPATARVLTRQEALIQGMRDIRLSPDGVRDIVRATDRVPTLDPKTFGEMVEKLVQVDGTVSKTQADQLKTLFKNELAPVKDSPVGTELNTAAKRLLEASETRVTSSPPPVVDPQKGIPNGQTAGNATLESAINAKVSELEQQFAAKNGAGGGDSAAAKQLEATQALLRGLENQRGAERRSRRGESEGGLLDSLRAALAGSKNDKGEGGPSSSGSDLGSSLKNALAHNEFRPPPRKGEDRDSKKSDPPRPEPRDRGQERGGLGDLAALLKGTGGNNSNKNDANKGEKGEEKFEIPPAKERPDSDSSKKGKLSNAKIPSPSDAPPVDPSAGEDPTKGLSDELPGAGSGKMTSLPGVSGGGGGSDPFAGFGGGGGSMSPSISGASAPASGGFDGDPFSGLGGGDGGGGGGQGFSFAKAVAYGSSGGDSSGGLGDVDGGGETSGPAAAAGYRSPVSNGSASLVVLAPHDDTKRSLLDYFGKLKHTLCGDPTTIVAVCQRVSGRKHIDSLRKRAASVR